MGFSKIETMQQPQTEWWMTIFNWIKDNTVIFACFALAWKGIDKVFKYFSESRDAELRKIVHEEMNAPIQSLTDQIQNLTKAIFSINKP